MEENAWTLGDGSTVNYYYENTTVRPSFGLLAALEATLEGIGQGPHGFRVDGTPQSIEFGKGGRTYLAAIN